MKKYLQELLEYEIGYDHDSWEPSCSNPRSIEHATAALLPKLDLIESIPMEATPETDSRLVKPRLEE